MFGALGDIHGDFASVRRIMRQHPDVPFWLCVGDVADAAGRYEPLDAPLYWIKGNNENFDRDCGRRSAGRACTTFRTARCRPIERPARRRLGGTFAPTMYDMPAAELPHPKKGTAKATELADKRRHFVREEVEACKRMHGRRRPPDARSAAAVSRRGRGNDAGKTPINEVLAAMKPRLHLFGHHHRFTERRGQGVRSVGLDLVSHSYLLVDAATLEYHVVFVDSWRSPPFSKRIDQRVLVCDGAMGTMLYAKGIFLNRSFDELNLTQPDLVAEVHQAYVRAGADVIETNTFGANRIKLGAFGLADQVHAINLQGAKIARHAAREQVYVAGAIGPLGIRIEPWGKTGVDEAEEFFREQARALRRRGRRPVRARDVPRRQRDRRGDPRGPQRLRPADRRAGDDRGGRQQPRRRARRKRSCRSSSASARTSSA